MKSLKNTSFKKIILSLVIFVIFFALIKYSYAEGILLEDYGGLLNDPQIDTLTKGDNASASIATYIDFLIKLAFGIGSIGAVVLIIWGGLDYISASFTKKETGKDKITKAIGAIVILALSFTVFTKINPETLVVRFKPITVEDKIDLPTLSLQQKDLGEDFVRMYMCYVAGHDIYNTGENCAQEYKPKYFTGDSKIEEYKRKCQESIDFYKESQEREIKLWRCFEYPKGIEDKLKGEGGARIWTENALSWIQSKIGMEVNDENANGAVYFYKETPVFDNLKFIKNIQKKNMTDDSFRIFKENTKEEMLNYCGNVSDYVKNIKNGKIIRECNIKETPKVEHSFFFKTKHIVELIASFTYQTKIKIGIREVKIELEKKGINMKFDN